MSTFKVELKKISKIYPHSNADKLELAQVEGITYQFAISKNLYKVGDEIIYFPIDSLLPLEFVEQQGIANFLAGKSRVKTVVLRGEVSQGYVASVESVKRFLNNNKCKKCESKNIKSKDDEYGEWLCLECGHRWIIYYYELPEDLTKALGVIKYELPEVKLSTGNLVGRPECVYYYDIEGCDNFPEILNKLMDLPCMISEKLEGTNYWCSINPEKKISVGQHNNAIENLPDKPEHYFWTVTRRIGFMEILLKLSERYENSTVTIRGEMIGPGIQKNYYRLKNCTVFIFDVEVNAKAINFKELGSLLEEFNLTDRFVPVISKDVTLREWLNGRTIREASHGESILIPTENTLENFCLTQKDKDIKKIREGIVIKPMEERYEVGFGRLFLKQRDPVYLDKTGN